MTATVERPASVPARRDAARPAAPTSSDTRVHTWVLSVVDWHVHALADPRAGLVWGQQATRCGWALIALPVTVACRGEVCERCLSGGLGRLELLPDRTGR